jgi:hypothetical protein
VQSCEAILQAVSEELAEAKAERQAAAKPLYYVVGDMVTAKEDFRTKDKKTGKFVTHSKGLVGKVLWIGDDSYNPGQKRTGFQLANGVVIYTSYGNLINSKGVDSLPAYAASVKKFEKLVKAAKGAQEKAREARFAHESKVPSEVLEACRKVLEHRATA